MTHINMTIIEYEVSPFLCFGNDIIDIMLLPNVGYTIMFRKQLEDVMNPGRIYFKVSTMHMTWMHHAQDPSLSARPSKLNTFGSPATTQQYSIVMAITLPSRVPLRSMRYFMESSGLNSISHRQGRPPKH